MQQSGKIILNYIPKSNIIGGIMSTIVDLMYSETDCDDYIVIDNIFKPIRQYPEDIDLENVIRCKPKTLIDNIKKIGSNDEEATGIIINDFDLDMDEIKSDLFPLLDNQNIVICVNTFIDEELVDDKKVSIELLTSNISEINDEEWEETKKEIEEEINSSVNKFVNKNESKKEEILEIFKDLNEYLIDDKDEDIFNVQQRHIYETDDNILKIEITDSNDLILSDEDNSIFIDNNQVKHLLNTLKYFNWE